MSVCKERPATLPPLDAIGLEPVDHTHAMSRGGSGHHRSSSAVPPSRQASIGLGFTPSTLGKSGANNLFSMGNFGTMGTGCLEVAHVVVATAANLVILNKLDPMVGCCWERIWSSSSSSQSWRSIELWEDQQDSAYDVWAE